MKIKTWTADLILLSVAFVWGATFVLVENAIAFLPPFSFNAIRFSIAACSLFIVLLLFYKHLLQQLDRRILVAGVVLGVWLFSGYLFQTVGLIYTTSSKAGFITGLSVVLVPIFSFLILKQKIGFNAIIGISLATCGLYLLTFGDMAGMNLGDLLVLCCAVSFAFQIVFTGKYAPSYPTLLLAFIQISTVAVLCFVGMVIGGEWKTVVENPSLVIEPVVILALLICALPATVFAFVAQTELQRYTTPTRVALIFATEPVFAAITDFWWNGHMLTVISLAGCGLILSGMVLSELKWRRKKRTAVVSIEK